MRPDKVLPGPVDERAAEVAPAAMLARMPAPAKPLPSSALAAIAQHASRQGGAVTRRQVLDAGLTASQERTQVRRGSWSREAAGVLVPRPADAPRDHVVDCGARLLQLRRRAVISHASAGLLHGFPWVDAPDVATVTVERPVRGASGVYVGRLLARHVTSHHGLPVTTPARTLVDLLRTARGRGRAQAIADGALLRGLDLGDVEEVLAECRGWPGIRQAREAWEHADGRSESPLESRCRVWFRDAGLPTPLLQVGIALRRGGTARVDFLFREQRTVVEADGRVKYVDETKDPDPAWRPSGDALWKEKLREDDLRDQGFEVVRATWADGEDHGQDLVRRVHRAFARAAIVRAA